MLNKKVTQHEFDRLYFFYPGFGGNVEKEELQNW